MTHPLQNMTLLSLTLAASACLPPQSGGQPDPETGRCGEGDEITLDAQQYCVYRSELIIEGFMCPNNLQRHDLSGSGLVVCGGPAGFDLPIDHEERIERDFDTSSSTSRPSPGAPSTSTSP